MTYKRLTSFGRTTLYLFSACVLSACQASQSGQVVSSAQEEVVSPIQETDQVSDQATNQAVDQVANQATTSTPTAPTNTESFLPSSATKTGELVNPELTEVSGLAGSIRYPNTFWAINDSGNAAKLFAFDNNGETLGEFNIAANNRDWEDLAAATINGEPYLLIGDIGDNLSVKTENTVHVIAEPLLNEPTVDALQPIYTMRFSYPDGAHNAEALSYANGYIYVLTKESLDGSERQASQAFRVPLNFNAGSDVIMAEEIARLAIPGGSMESGLIALLAGVDVTQPTAFEIDRQNRFAYVLTYRSVYRYERAPTQSWADVLASPRNRVHSHSLSQAEAIAVDTNGVVWFTSEQRPAPLWALPAADY